MADVRLAIADFLGHLNFGVDLHSRCLIDGQTGLFIHDVQSLHLLKEASALSVVSCYYQILAEFLSIANLYNLDLPVKHAVTHHIVTTGPPIFARPCRLCDVRLAIACRELEHMLQLGIVQPSPRSWSLLLHLVPKKTEGDWRPHGDCRALNAHTVADRHPLLHIHDFAANLADRATFSKIDLVKAYHQIPVEPPNVPKTAIVMPFGLFEYVRMPFRLRNVAQMFQHLIDEVVRGLDFVFAYLDDPLVTSRSA